MFEKESEEYADKYENNRGSLEWWGLRNSYQVGAVYGYDKAIKELEMANEWHYVKERVYEENEKMAKTELKEQLKSYEGYINDIPLVIDPCRMCKVYKAKSGYDTGHFDSDGQWDDSNSCKMCCWYYDSKFEVGNDR